MTIYMERYWTYDIIKNIYTPAKDEPLSAFPTIVDTENMKVFCRLHHTWEPIAAFNKNVLKTGCGKLYTGPFRPNNSTFNYGYQVSKRKGFYHIKIHTQTVNTENRRLIDVIFELDTEKHRLMKNGKLVFSTEEISGMLCKEIADKILDEMGEEYKNTFGIKPTVASKLTGFSVVLGYMLSPFNVNFYKISQHWGLNPYDEDFASLSSGDTPNAENEMFGSLGIKPTKAIRKLYQKNPRSVICYAAAQDLGFTDVNILQHSYSMDFYNFLCAYMISFAGGDIQYMIRDSLKIFARDMLAISDQKTVWNSIERTVKNYKELLINNYIVTDAINMYPPCSEHLTEREKKEIMREGFNEYTHDFILRRRTELGQVTYEGGKIVANVIFPIEQQFLNLEYKAGEAYKTDETTKERVPVPDEERWCFYVARDSATLRKIGSEMSNCVGWGYKDAVYNRRATIVYALHHNQYKICIEVTPQFTIRQAFGPHNKALIDDAFDAFSEWCKEKHLSRQNVFSVHVAP